LIMAQRLWQGGAGVLTIIFVTHFMSTATQGWYYSFLSFAALYTLFDLGLSLVLVQTAAHMAVDLHWTADGGLEGVGAERLRALFAFASRFYIRLALGFAFLVGPAGWLFFSAATAQPVVWQPVWIALTLVTAFSLLPLPVLAVVEGSGDVSAVARVRLSQSIIASVATWTVLLCGGGLWATVMAPLASFFTTIGWVWFFRRRLVDALQANHRLILWRTEILPLQWRLGMSWLSGYLLTQIQVLVLFAAKDATAAGQMGLSLTIGNMIGLIAQAFIARHVPAMAKAAARRDWTLMDALFRKDFALSCLLFGGAAAGAVLLVAALGETRYAARILSLAPFAGLLLALFMVHVQSALATQLRSYRREPLVWIAVTGAIATLALGMLAARNWGADGVVAAMAGIQILFVFPCSVIVFIRRNGAWRAD
jgi:O-antigen/teichoic acid export membrane protein